MREMRPLKEFDLYGDREPLSQPPTELLNPIDEGRVEARPKLIYDWESAGDLEPETIQDALNKMGDEGAEALLHLGRLRYDIASMNLIRLANQLISEGGRETEVGYAKLFDASVILNFIGEFYLPERGEVNG